MRPSLCWHLAALAVLSLPVHAQNQYVGVETCAECHDTNTPGNTIHAWRSSQHAAAYQTLRLHSEKEPRECQGLQLWIVDSGRGVRYGLPRPAHESKECLPCHTTAFGAGPQLLAPAFDPKAGVQCESCHGPGSAHVQAMAAKDHGNAAAGLERYEDERTIEARCRACHEGTCGDFDFGAMWPKIRHSGAGKQ